MLFLLLLYYTAHDGCSNLCSLLLKAMWSIQRHGDENNKRGGSLSLQRAGKKWAISVWSLLCSGCEYRKVAFMLLFLVSMRKKIRFLRGSRAISFQSGISWGQGKLSSTQLEFSSLSQFKLKFGLSESSCPRQNLVAVILVSRLVSCLVVLSLLMGIYYQKKRQHIAEIKVMEQVSNLV